MKITTILAVLAFTATPALALTNYMDPCAEKAPHVVKAIGQYCTRLGTKNVVPNANANKGRKAKYQGKYANVRITANCNPGQWVPQEFCMRQFYQICAESPKGKGARKFGRNQCQGWYIY